MRAVPGLLGFRLRDADRYECCSDDERHEHDGGRGGERAGDRLEEGGQAEQARIGEMKDGGDGWEGGEVHGEVRSWKRSGNRSASGHFTA